MRMLKWQYKVRNMPKKRLLAIVDIAVWEKERKGLAGIWWDSVVEKARKDRRVNVRREVWELQGISTRKDRNKGEAVRSAKKTRWNRENTWRYKGD